MYHWYIRVSAMKPIQIDASATSKASPADVFALLKDGSTWPRWSMFTGFELDRAGKGDPLGVGAVRVFVSPTARSYEEIVELVEGRQLSYVLRAGMPFKDYRADVTLEPGAAGGADISWRARFEPQRPAARWFWALVMRWVLGSTAKALAKAANDPSMVAAARANIAAAAAAAGGE